MKFKVDKAVFEKFPNLVIYLPIILGFDNTKSKEAALVFLRQAETELKEKMTLEDFLKDLRITSYLDCFKNFGTDPEKFKPAHAALATRVLEGGQLPDINPVVNLYNAFSLKYLTPFGGENLDAVYGDFILKFADGGEQWIPIGGGKNKPAVKGELIWGDDFDLSTRALNWRQCDRTKMTADVKNGYFVMDGFIGVNDENIKIAAQDFIKTMQDLFGGKGQIYVLDKNNPEIEIDFQSKKIEEVKKVAKKIEKTMVVYQPSSIAFSLQRQVYEAIKATYPDIEIEQTEIILEHPTVEEFGDYSTNIALRMSKEQGTGNSPREIAEKIKNNLNIENVEKIDIAGPGFINFTLSKEFLVEELEKIDEKYGAQPKNGKKIVIELVSPNINKPLHIGHLRNAALGMSLSNIFSANGWEVIRDEINNDRGLHIMKAVYGYLLFGRKNKDDNYQITWRELLDEWKRNRENFQTPQSEERKPDFFVGYFYVRGEKFLTENEDFAGKQLTEMLQSWEAEEKDIWNLWQTMSDWVHQGLDQTYKRIGVSHDKRWYEHLLYKEGRDYILEALNKGVFEKLPDGAIQANLKPFGLENKILIRRDGTAIYMTFDIALTKHKVEEYRADKYIWVVGNDQIDHFKRLFVIFEMLGLGHKEDFYHLAYGMVRVPGGKMSSRLGNVVLADDLLDKIKELAKKNSEEVSEDVAVGAVKYAMIKVDPMATVTFDLEKSVALDGDSGPYLQYTYARAKSVLRKAHKSHPGVPIGRDDRIFEDSIATLQNDIKAEENALLRYLYRFPEVVEQAAKQYAPNMICTYLFELAKRFNNFYNNCPIISEDQTLTSNRLLLTASVAQVLSNGLSLLGIKVLEKM